jgi:glycine oxidase
VPDPRPTDAPPTDAVVVGAGVIGLGVAWRLAQNGRRVVVLEKGAAGRGASWAAGGMLAPAAEIGFEELDLYRLGRESLRRWPDFAKALNEASGQNVGYRTEGTLVVADDRDSARALRRLYRFQEEHGAPVQWLSADEAQEIEPLLSPRLPAAVFAPEDHQVDNRAVVSALLASARAAGVEIREGVEVKAVVPDAGRPAVISKGGERVEGKTVVLAAGAWSAEIGGLAPGPPVRPVTGEAIGLRMAPPVELTAVVRTPHAYLVPKPDGRLVLGATSEERGFDQRVTAGGLWELLDKGRLAIPALDEWTVEETWAGLRPAARDHAPILGFDPRSPGVCLATGHYRHGLLLLPVTADEVAREIEARWSGGAGSDVLPPFSPGRF